MVCIYSGIILNRLIVNHRTTTSSRSTSVFAFLEQFSKEKAYKIEEMTAVNPGAKRLKIIYGPYKLQAANVGLLRSIF
jgi:hypothetical protein